MRRGDFLRRAGLLAGAASLAGAFPAAALARRRRRMPSYPVLEGPKDPRPNIIFILTDDQERTSLDHMPNLKREFGEKGRVFANSVISSPLCGIARTTLQNGMYARNHGVWTNLGPTGGYERMRATGLDKDTAAVRLKAAGYQTAHVGKYQNGYGGYSVPPGWDRWLSKVQSKDFMAWGSGPSKWVPITGLPSGDGLTRRAALDWLPEMCADTRPFFLQLGFYAPHGPADYQGQYEEMFQGWTVPRTPDFDEEDMGDKPELMRLYDRLTEAEKAEYDELYRKKLRASQFVDAYVGRLFSDLEALGQLENTFVFFYTDNGVHMGAHRLEYGKNAPYDTDVRFPLHVRGPGVTAGVDVRMVSNADFVPTWTGIGGADGVVNADGESLLPLFGGEDAPWRNVAFSEKLAEDTGSKRWTLARNARYSYVSRDTGEEELYDLETDPYEVESRHGDDSLAAEKEALRAALAGFEGA